MNSKPSRTPGREWCVGILAALAGTGCGLSAAHAAPIAPDTMAGRWSGETYSFAPERKPLTLDIVPCGESWCGVEVTKDGACGGTALRLGQATERGNNSLEFTGRLELTGGEGSYAILATFLPTQGERPAIWAFSGNTGPEVILYQRSFPFNAHLRRTADAVCTAEQKTS